MVSRIEQIVKNVDKLPSLPMVATKLLSLVDKQTSVAKDLAEVIEKDQALTARMLKLVNSAFFGLSSKVTTVSRAVVVLGFNSVKSLGLGISVFNAVSEAEGEQTAFDKNKFWEHALGVAAGARILAKKMKYQNHEEAFVAGLLHDIGKVIFDQYAEKEFLEALEFSKNERIPLVLAEKKIIGTDHEVAGEYLAEKWKLPYPLKMAISRHHNPPVDDKTMEPQAVKLIAVVNMANTLCKMQKIGFSGNAFISGKDEEVLLWSQIDSADIDLIRTSLEEEVLRAKDFFGMTGEADEEEKTEEVSEEIIEEKQKAVIVEKVPKAVNMARILLEGVDYDVQISASNEELAAFVKETTPSLILLDGFDDGEAGDIQNSLKDITGKPISFVMVPVPFDSGVLLKELEKQNISVDFKQLDGTQKRILVVDDEVGITKLLKDMLQLEGYKVMTLNNPEETMMKVDDFKPHLITLDLKMPKMDGLTLLRLLRKYLQTKLQTKQTKIMIISAFVSDDIRKALISFGVKEIMNKPFDQSMLKQKIKDLLSEQK